MPHVVLQQTKPGSGTGSSLVVTLDNPPKAGAAIIAAVAIDTGTESVSSVTSDGGGWFKLGEKQEGSETRLEVWAATDLDIGAGQSVTINFTSSVDAAAVLSEYVGPIASPTDQAASNSGSGASATTGTTGTTTQAEELAFAAISSDEEGASLSSPLNGYTIQDEADGPSGVNNQHIGVLDLELSATQTTSTGATITPAAGGWAALLFTLKLYQAGTKYLGGSSDAQSGWAGGLTTDTTLSGTCVASADGDGDLDVEWSLSGPCLAQAGGVGELTVSSGQLPVEAELPAVYVDDAVIDNAQGLVLANRNPEPDETGVPADTVAHIELWNTGSAAVDPSATVVRFDGVIAFNAGAWVNGYTGSTASLTSPGAGSPDGMSIDITPPADFASLDVVTIRVQSDVVGGGFAVDTSWDFTVEDLTPPSFLSAVAMSQRVVRVVFDEPVKIEDESDPDDALNPSNYSFSALNDIVTPAVPLEAVSVAQVDETTVDITVDTEMTPRVEYSVTAENIVDLSGNQV